MSGEPLAGTTRRRDGIVGFDLVFAAPRSVSVLAAVGESRSGARCGAHASGVRAGLDHLMRVSFAGGATGEPPSRGGLCWRGQPTRMARLGDPQLHAHLVTADRVRGEDGRWSAPDIRPVYAEAKIAGTIADAVIRDALTKSPGVPTLAYRREEDRRAGA